MEFMELIAMIPAPVLIVAAVVFVIMTLILTCQYLCMKGLNGIRVEVYQLILRAEHIYTASGAGQEKLMWVVQQTRSLLPAWMQLMISEDTLVRIINEWFTGVKDLLDDGKVNGSQKGD